MKVGKLLIERQQAWTELDRLLGSLERNGLRKRKMSDLMRLGHLYRGACADLMLAESYDLPTSSVAFLHSLVARSQRWLYPSKAAFFVDWAVALFTSVPKKLRGDWAFWTAIGVFFGSFIVSILAGAASTDFAVAMAGEAMLEQAELSFAQPIGNVARVNSAMAGFYIQHNAGIGLKCYGYGVIPIIGPIVVLLTQGLALGAVFGHITILPQSVNFYNFVTAHSVFELTAIAIAGSGGIRLGWGLIAPGNRTRIAAFRRSALDSLPQAGVATLFFIIAAFIEGFISGEDIPYAFKAGVAIVSLIAITAYLALPGRNWAALAQGMHDRWDHAMSRSN